MMLYSSTQRHGPHKKSRSMDIFTEFYAKNEVVKSVVIFLICDGPFELKFKEVSPILGGGCGGLTDF